MNYNLSASAPLFWGLQGFAWGSLLTGWASAAASSFSYCGLIGSAAAVVALFAGVMFRIWGPSSCPRSER
jgi:hypothetical protein